MTCWRALPACVVFLCLWTDYFFLQPLRIGLLWYLNVHASPPYRWQRCQAVLYPNMLLLSWIAQGGGRGVVTLDLLNCTEVRSVASPTHPSAQDDVGTIAAKTQTANAQAEGFGELGLLETLCPFQLFYGDGVERLGAESARERVRWVSAIWYVLWCQLFLQLMICLGRSLIAPSQCPIGLKHSHPPALCVRYGRWRARVHTPVLPCLARVLPHSSHPWRAFLICLISSLFRDLAQDPCLANHLCAPALLMMLRSPTKPSSTLETRGLLPLVAAAHYGVQHP